MTRPGRDHGINWSLIFRLCEQKLRMRKWDVGRYTLTQLVNALDASDPNDPHAHGIPINSLADLDDM